MTKTTILTLSEDQLMRLLDGMLSVEQPLDTSEPGNLHFPSNDRKAHEALIERLNKALERVS